MPNTAHIQEAAVSFPTITQIRRLYLYTPKGLAQWGKPLSPKQVDHLRLLLRPKQASQLTVTLRPDVVPDVTFDGFEAFSIYHGKDNAPTDPDIAALYKYPLVDYHLTKPSFATCLASIITAARRA